MITSSGPKCDICDKYILPITELETVNNFKVKGIDEMLQSCNGCKKILENSKGDWKQLPKGRLRKAFEEQSDTVG